MSKEVQQSSNTVLMIRPANFGYNQETAENNSFMENDVSVSSEKIKEIARSEFDGLVNVLRAVGTNVIVVNDTENPIKPDCVFPNNWFSTHTDGIVVTYPMFAESRRIERTNPVLEVLERQYVYDVQIALERSEAKNIFLEGTGSMVLDRKLKVCYACISERTDVELTKKWCKLMGYTPVLFTSVDANGDPVYHTNVIMAMGTHHAVICMDSILEKDKGMVSTALQASGRKIVELSYDQILHYSGNMLEVLDGESHAHWVMSSQAYGALTDEQRAILEEKEPILHAPIQTIEKLGGGSARCMIAEVFLSEK